MKRVFLLAAATLLSTACEPTLSSEQKAELQKTLAEARSRAEALEKERREAFHAAKGTVAPRPDLGPCPFDKQLPLLDFTKGPPVPESIMDDLLVLDRVGFVRGDEIEIECAGVVVAENSSTVKVEVPADAPNRVPAGGMSNIEADLIAQAVKAGKKALVRAGPPP